MAKIHLHNRTPCLGLPCMIGAATHAALLPAPSDALSWGSIWEVVGASRAGVAMAVASLACFAVRAY